MPALPRFGFFSSAFPHLNPPPSPSTTLPLRVFRTLAQSFSCFCRRLKVSLCLHFPSLSERAGRFLLSDLRTTWLRAVPIHSPFSIALPTLRDDNETDAFNYDRSPRLDLTALFPSIGLIITVFIRSIDDPSPRGHSIWVTPGSHRLQMMLSRIVPNWAQVPTLQRLLCAEHS